MRRIGTLTPDPKSRAYKVACALCEWTAEEPSPSVHAESSLREHALMEHPVDVPVYGPSPEEPDVKAALEAAEPILALLHFRGIIDTPTNREDVERALRAVRDALLGSAR